MIFYFAWDPTAVAAIDLAPGVLWVTFTFAGLLGQHRSFAVEASERAMDGLLVSPIDREAIYLGRALANLVFVTGIQCAAVPAMALFYNVPIGPAALPLAASTAVAAIGFVGLGPCSARWP